MKITALLLFFSGLVFAQLKAGDVVKLPSAPPAAKIAYGPAPQQYAELRLPAGKGPFPVVAILHGGCWIEYATADYMAHFATALTKEGFATWNAEYRRAHEAGGGWPGTFDDAEHGVAAVDRAAQYPLDLRRVVVIGHSAGGQLALYTGSRLHRPALSLAGVIDIRAFARDGAPDCAAGAVRVMGGTPEQHPDRYHAVSPSEMLPLKIPQVLVWGEADTIVPERLFSEYEKRARAAGDRVQVLRVRGAGHHDLCSADGPGWRDIVAAIRALVPAAP
jgi:acetyl esterase/lipase